MYVVVGGAGEVGYHVARALRDEGHDVCVVETNPDRLERLAELDVATVKGNIANKAILEGEAKIADAQLFIACTGDDEVNMIAAAIAKTHGPRTIARINDNEYLNVPYSDEYAKIGIDVAVCPEMVAAIRIKRMLNQPQLVNADVFAQGKVFVAEGRVEPDSFVVGKRLDEVEPPAGFHLFAIYRGDEALIPKGHMRFRAGDRLVMALTSMEVLKDVEPYIGQAKQVKGGTEVKRVMIAGATRIGVQLARLLEQSKRDVVLVEKDEAKAKWAGERLQRTLVVLGDATDRHVLTQENVDTFDAFVGCHKVEEYNVLAAMLAKRLGVPLTVATVNQPELKGFLEEMGIDLAVAPRLSTVGAILKAVHPGSEDLALQNLGEERLMVFRVAEASPLATQRIKKVGFPDQAHVAAIVRGDVVVLPRGDETLEAGDQVLVFTLTESVEQLERLFA
ncbi:MAG: trk/ktr system potassium uptake protein [Thermoplasmata archaeon]|jgi:trk system potassium uptake protein TrkA|nr:trk/ktr system potassium uptake protein [Thermoplasmata archaeon]